MSQKRADLTAVPDRPADETAQLAAEIAAEAGVEVKEVQPDDPRLCQILVTFAGPNVAEPDFMVGQKLTPSQIATAGMLLSSYARLIIDSNMAQTIQAQRLAQSGGLVTPDGLPVGLRRRN